jgi:hypothetical protein
VEEEQAAAIVERLSQRGLFAHVHHAGVYQFGVRVVIPDGREAIWDADGAAGLEAAILEDGDLVGFVPTIPGSTEFDVEQMATAIAAVDYDAPPADAPATQPAGTAAGEAPAVTTAGEAPAATAAGEAPAGTAAGEAPAATTAGEAPAATAAGEAPAAPAGGNVPDAAAPPERPRVVHARHPHVPRSPLLRRLTGRSTD